MERFKDICEATVHNWPLHNHNTNTNHQVWSRKRVISFSKQASGRWCMDTRRAIESIQAKLQKRSCSIRLFYNTYNSNSIEDGKQCDNQLFLLTNTVSSRFTCSDRYCVKWTRSNAAGLVWFGMKEICTKQENILEQTASLHPVFLLHWHRGWKCFLKEKKTKRWGRNTPGPLMPSFFFQMLLFTCFTRRGQSWQRRVWQED